METEEEKKGIGGGQAPVKASPFFRAWKEEVSMVCTDSEVVRRGALPTAPVLCFSAGGRQGWSPASRLACLGKDRDI